MFTILVMYGVPRVVMVCLRGCSFKMSTWVSISPLKVAGSNGAGFLIGTFIDTAFRFLEPITVPMPPRDAVRSPEWMTA